MKIQLNRSTVIDFGSHTLKVFLNRVPIFVAGGKRTFKLSLNGGIIFDESILAAGEAPTCTITMDDYNLKDIETATITFSFDKDVTGFAIDDISVPHGTLSAFTQVTPSQYTVLYTPTADISDSQNVVTVLGASGQFSGMNSNPSDQDFIGDNYTLYTYGEYPYSFVLIDGVPQPDGLGGFLEFDTQLTLSAITEDIAGSCEYPNSGTCDATGTYSIVASGNDGIVTYNWTCVGGTITSGQGTDTVQVQTTSDTNTTFDLTCTAQDLYLQDIVQTNNFTHTRTEQADTVAPVITLLGSTPIDVNNGSTYTDAGATATDNVDGDITANIVTVNNVNTATNGQYTVTYNVSDAAGNPATEVIRTVNVVESLGTEMLSNGSLDDSTDWTVFGETESNIATFSGGTLTLDQGETLLGVMQTNLTIEAATTYQLGYEIVSHTVGGVRGDLGGTEFDLATTVGTHTIDILTTATATDIKIYAGYYGDTSTNIIDNLSLKEKL